MILSDGAMLNGFNFARIVMRKESSDRASGNTLDGKRNFVPLIDHINIADSARSLLPCGRVRERGFCAGQKGSWPFHHKRPAPQCLLYFTEYVSGTHVSSLRPFPRYHLITDYSLKSSFRCWLQAASNNWCEHKDNADN
jgi:hypothetical protein